MSIFLDKNSKVLVQGITGSEGSYHTGRMLAYGTNIVGGVTPGKGGQKTEHGLPVFDTVHDAVAATGATHTCIFVPPPFAADALFEAHDAGITFAVCITEGVPVHDVLKVVGATPGMRIIGPNCPGLISPGKSSVGIMPGHVFKEGNVGLISRSGTLTYEVVDLLTRAGFGQSTCVGIGGDPIIGSTFVDCLREFKNDGQTEAIVVCGEIGGSDEEDAAAFIKAHMPQMPIVAFIGGRNAPPGKSLGHAGAIISGKFGTPQSKIDAFQAAGVPVADRPSQIPSLLAQRMPAGVSS
ncbi:MAG TPA: succinate--CoA ligase subunit alpha [Candidatus Baltobacteraceae bacterium]|jgi:succinyl-CoA synthetase alpha subunit|nr:succinate--CoA ligase subunit alpha [Candidatus Baltobacteraceae bacterium]